MLQKHIVRPFDKEIIVPWPDFGLPSVEPTFWGALHAYARTYKADLDKDVSVCFHCAAGHGRTGTALCSMLVAIEKHFKRSKTDMAGCEAGQHGTGFNLFTVNFIITVNQAQGTGSRYAKTMHGLAAEVFPD